jgi:hypothetical protein
MLDNTPDDTAHTPTWQDAITWGDVVLFRFPIRLAGEEESPEARPCLVLDRPAIFNRRYLLIACGTDADPNANRGCEIDVRGAEVKAVGLHRNTRFVAARRVRVPLDHPGLLVIGDTGSPILGKLSGQSFKRMNRVRARIFAEADMAAERRSNRRIEARKAASGRCFQLERKSRQKPTGAP